MREVRPFSRRLAPLLGAFMLVTIAAAPVAAQQAELTFWDLMTLRSAGSLALSPDGSTVAFTVSQLDTASMESATHIWTAPTDGSQEPRQFTNGSTSESAPRFTPDGTHLTFIATRGESGRQVWKIPLDGGEAVQMTHFDEGLPGTPIWNREMTKFAYTERAEWPDKEEREARAKEKDDVIIVEEDRTLFSDIHVYDLESGETTRVTEDAYDNGGPVWSPDGAWIAFSSNRTRRPWYNSNSDLFIVPSGGGEVRRLTANEGSDGSPTFSPDGSWIVYSANTSPGRSHEDSDYFAIPIGGGTPRILTASFDHSVGGSVHFAADGRSFLFTAAIQTETQLFRCDVASGRVEQLSDRTGLLGSYTVTEDGRMAAWTFNAPDYPTEVFAGPPGAEVACPP